MVPQTSPIRLLANPQWRARAAGPGGRDFPVRATPTHLPHLQYREPGAGTGPTPDLPIPEPTPTDGEPSVRQVLLKAADDRGFVFYTNYDSRKGLEIAENPYGALAIHWPILQRQVRINGAVEKTSTEESQAYFDSRPRGSRIGAWASDQSSVLRGRNELERKFRETQERFSSADVPLPDFWGGYRVIPKTIEFWQGRANRLHDRLRFTRDGAGWTIDRLYP